MLLLVTNRRFFGEAIKLVSNESLDYVYHDLLNEIEFIDST